jgi:hypothetical protein
MIIVSANGAVLPETPDRELTVSLGMKLFKTGGPVFRLRFVQPECADRDEI